MKRVLAAFLSCIIFNALAFADSTPNFIITTASSNATLVQNGPTRLTSLDAINTTATLAYIHFYDITTSGFSCGGTGEKHIIPVPAATTGAGVTPPMTEPELYQKGLAFCVTGAGTSGDSSNAPVGVYINYDYR